MFTPASAAERLNSVRERMERALFRSGRPEGSVGLLAVTKTRTSAEVRELYDLGARLFGENRVDEAAEKRLRLPGDAEWHMIGHVQSNKAKACLGFACVHSVDKPGTARALDRVFADSAPLDVLLEANTGGEESKDGVRDLDGLKRLAEAVAGLNNLRIRGLMTMAPLGAETVVRPCFARLRGWRDELARAFPDQGWSTLSMGMSNDFEWAIEEGSTLVRVGTALFEARR